MAKKNLENVQLLISPLSGRVYIGVTDKTGMFSDNKKDVTQEFKNMMMAFFDKNKDCRCLESEVGIITFEPKEEKQSE